MVAAILCPGVRAQRLHDQKRQDQAEQALKQAEEIASASLFETQLKNLRTLEEHEVAMVMRNARRNTRQVINSFDTWASVFIHMDIIKAQLAAADARARQNQMTSERAQADLKREIERARAELAALRKNSADVEDESLSLQFASLSDLEPAASLLSELLAKTVGEAAGPQIEALGKAKDVFAELADLYKKVNERVKQIQGLKDQLGEFNEGLQEIAIKSLEVEAEHLKLLAAIEARRGLELADARLLIEQFDTKRGQLLTVYYRSCFGRPKTADVSGEHIVDTFELARNMTPCSVTNPNSRLTSSLIPRDAVKDLMQFLMTAAAIQSKVPRSNALAELRTAEEHHRYSLRRRALQASVYELTMTAGALRLALFYKGGIKPAQLAQLIHNAANIATPFAIFTR
jgi:regulator of replication initiation timing